MDAGQFSQVVMLPQGSFATFLQAKVDERKAPLVKPFSTQDLAYPEKWLHDRSKEAAAEQKGETAQIKSRIDAGWGAVAGLAAEALALSDGDEELALQGSLLPEELPDPADAAEVAA